MPWHRRAKDASWATTWSLVPAVTTITRLPFEKPIYELEEKLAHLESQLDPSPETESDIRKTRADLTRLKRDVFDSLDPWDVVINEAN